MDNNTDLTNFWLAWRKTCSIRLCLPENLGTLQGKCKDSPELLAHTEEISNLASEVKASTNAYFRRCVSIISRGRRSLYEDEIRSWNDNKSLGSAFEILEGEFYGKGTINGKKFKDYLFEDAANRPGGINKNLYGYFQKTLRSIANESLGEIVYTPRKNTNGTEIPPETIMLDGKTEMRGETQPPDVVEAREVVAFFNAFVDGESAGWDDDDWIVLFCILNLIPVGGAKVKPLLVKSHDTIATKAKRIRERLLTALRAEGFSDSAIGLALDGDVQNVLSAKMANFRFYQSLLEIFEENRKSTGK